MKLLRNSLKSHKKSCPAGAILIKYIVVGIADLSGFRRARASLVSNLSQRDFSIISQIQMNLWLLPSIFLSDRRIPGSIGIIIGKKHRSGADNGGGGDDSSMLRRATHPVRARKRERHGVEHVLVVSHLPF